MADTDDCKSDQFTVSTTGGTELESVGVDSGVSAIKSVHFTASCTKPWMCRLVEVREEKSAKQSVGEALKFSHHCIFLRYVCTCYRSTLATRKAATTRSPWARYSSREVILDTKYNSCPVMTVSKTTSSL